MGLHETQDSGSVLSMKLCAEIRNEMERQELLQEDLGQRLNIDGTNVGRMLKGRTSLTVDRVWEVETALGLAHGTLYRRAGYIQSDGSLEEWIENDPNLAADQRNALLLIIGGWRRAQLSAREPAGVDAEKVVPMKTAAQKRPSKPSPK